MASSRASSTFAALEQKFNEQAVLLTQLTRKVSFLEAASDILHHKIQHVVQQTEILETVGDTSRNMQDADRAKIQALQQKVAELELSLEQLDSDLDSGTRSAAARERELDSNLDSGALSGAARALLCSVCRHRFWQHASHQKCPDCFKEVEVDPEPPAAAEPMPKAKATNKGKFKGWGKVKGKGSGNSSNNVPPILSGSA